MKISNENYIGSAGRISLIDLEIPQNFNGNLIVFVHGYMGFKDWGPWNLMQTYFVERGYGFCKFNMTHNGTTPEHPMDFVALEAFGNNCYSYEKKDLLHVLDWLERRVDLSKCSLHLVGHSRGGGIALLCSDDHRVSTVTTLAAISSIAKRFTFPDETMEEWQKLGVRFVRNGRTNQDLPHNFFQYIDFQNNTKELTIQTVCERIKKPLLLIHGDKDESVSISEGYDLALWSGNELSVIQNATHTFGGSHPYDEKMLPIHLEDCCKTIVLFLQNHELEDAISKS
jgi:pimeloyl-ACP methyl ester carboxylesterase